MDKGNEQAVEAAVFRRLIAHLQNRTDVQNIDLMLLAGFCRNCLSEWYREATIDCGGSLKEADAKQHVYGMPYETWKGRHQLPVPKDKVAAFKELQARGDWGKAK